MISLAITTYNRSNVDSFIRVLNNDLISEVVIVDDCSDRLLDNLRSAIASVNNGKIKLFQNKENLGPMLNKREAINQCENDWVILLDSDNIIDNDYIKIVGKLTKEEDIFYSPEILYANADRLKIRWDYKEYINLLIDKKNVKRYLDEKHFTTLLNTGNCFINKTRYLDVMSQYAMNSVLSVNDALYFSYLWLLRGNRIKVLPDLSYVHNVNNDSWYINNYKKCECVTSEIINKIKQL
jgi:glycosyltransferase involved in cell wall biosynthesis